MIREEKVRRQKNVDDIKKALLHHTEVVERVLAQLEVAELYLSCVQALED